MGWQFLLYALLQIMLSALGWWLGGVWGVAAALAVLAWLVALLRNWQAQRVLRWIGAGAVADQMPQISGPWGRAAGRTRRLLRETGEQAKASDARLQEILAALQASPNGVTLLDAQGRIEWCNQIAQSHFGFEGQRDTLQSLGYLLRAPEFNAYLAAQDFSSDVILPGRASSPERPVNISVQIFPYGDGRQLLLSRDITALQQAEAMRRDFVANVSHEIRTPLTVLMGFVETLQTLDLNEAERKHFLGLMAQQAARMQNLVQDLLALSRMEGSPPPTLDDWIPVSQLLSLCENEARTLAASLLPTGTTPLVLEFPTAEQLAQAGEVAGIAAELHSALSNLINNAVRYTPAGGRVTVTWLMQADGRARFAVRDTGTGIAPEHLPRLTERFYRADRSRSRDTGGTGLGLAIVKHALQRHGAELHISSQLGKGSEFAVTWPAQRLRSPSALAQAEAASEAF
jgi:two-component system phosphate regulon sensor histidine kinase PhoR